MKIYYGRSIKEKNITLSPLRTVTEPVFNVVMKVQRPFHVLPRTYQNNTTVSDKQFAISGDQSVLQVAQPQRKESSGRQIWWRFRPCDGPPCPCKTWHSLLLCLPVLWLAPITNDKAGVPGIFTELPLRSSRLRSNDWRTPWAIFSDALGWPEVFSLQTKPTKNGVCGWRRLITPPSKFSLNSDDRTRGIKLQDEKVTVLSSRHLPLHCTK